MSIATYSGLKNRILQIGKRGDMSSRIDDLIAAAEADMWHELRVKEMLAQATANAPSDRYLELPDGFLEMRRFEYTSGGQTIGLEYVAPESLKVVSGAGRPTQFTVGSQITLDQIPADTYEMRMHYYKEWTALSSANPANAVLSRYPNIYLYGVLYHYAQEAMNDKMLTKYSALFDAQIKRANKMDRKGRHGPAPAMRTEASTP